MEIKQHTSKQPMGQRGTQKGNKRYLETNENKNMTNQIFWDAAKVVLRRKFRAINMYIKKLKIFQT